MPISLIVRRRVSAVSKDEACAQLPPRDLYAPETHASSLLAPLAFSPEAAKLPLGNLE